MSWINSLYETYNNCLDVVGVIDNDETVLLPISHSTQNAQIEITIDMNGNFKRANKVDKKDAVTIIPVTEDSGSRGNGNFPHPLCDKLCYIARDYSHYNKKKDMSEYFNTYIGQLGKWCNSEFAHEKAVAVWRYLSKSNTIKDLIDEKVLEFDDKGALSDKVNKIQGLSQLDSFVRFIVQNDENNKTESKVWKDKSLYNSFIKYYNKTKIELDNCYITGELVPCSDKHPSKVRNSGDKAKLISANDSSGFTYRGRFTEKNQAASVGYEASQKAHNALRWLIQKQGYTRDGAAIVSWAINGAEIPNPCDDTDDLFEEVSDNNVDTAISYAKRLNKAIDGYRVDLTTSTKIVVMAVDAATTGRLSITYYREINGSEFLDRILEWHLQCSWKHFYKKNEEGYYAFIGAPSPREIAITAFGIDQNGMLKANDKLIRSTVERLLPCIVDGRKIPYDIVNAAFNNATRPMAMTPYNWQRVLSNTCAIIKKYRYEKNKEVWNMALDLNNRDRSYLFGRLLAVADMAESITYEYGEKRETNAKRYMNIFSKRPAKTWKIIAERLIPYFNKMHVGQRLNYENMINEIASMFEDGAFNNEALSELYLLGYYCQSDFMKSKKDKNIISEMEEVENE